MKLLIVLAAFLVVTAAIEEYQAEHKHIPIVHSELYQKNDGSFKFAYESGNGIQVHEQGHVKNLGDKEHETNVAHGSFSYIDPHGVPVSLSYVADENGFQAHGSHIPTPPPLPKELVEAYAKVGSHPEMHHEEPESYKLR
ncbi:endocuticle structural glycoprotein SgAbd-2-like [Toxorhynchites rutilus septentrionalis]|uniref:endocuticle structural glycoprotein SgAbd-2-like n=1 Tax=Toxorhynchites rutilus septentrionalis TaxID=329112 RepID=UPI00247B2AD1|nr:endocuticle structural glycoprotein SgAbd-2-like [Toxorhynchites rutilus septentrionalis]